MGWNPFSGNDILITNSTIVNVVEDTPDLVKQSILSSVLQNTDINKDLIYNLLTCLGIKGKQYYEYGKNNFTNGLPIGSMGQISVDLTKLTDFINKHIPVPEGKIWEITEAHGMQFDPIFFLAFNNGRFDYKYYKINPQSVSYYYVYNPESAHPEIRPVTYKVDYFINTTDTYYFINYSPKDIVTGVVDTKDARIVSYWKEDSRYPELKIIDPPSKFTQFMPIVPLRINNISYTDKSRKKTPLYKTSKELLSKLGLKIEKLDEGINKNPDIKSIDHIYFTMGIDIKATKQSSKAYIFEFFNDLKFRSSTTKTIFDNWLNRPNKRKDVYPPANKMTIQDHTFKATLYYYYIQSTDVTGSIGSVGSYDTSWIFDDWIPIFHPDHPVERIGQRISHRSSFTVRKQKSKNKYTEIKVVGLFYSNDIYNIDRAVITDLSNSEGQQILLPLNISIIEKIDLLKSNELYYDAMKLVCNAYEFQHLKWYQTELFRFIVMAVSIAISIMSGGIGSFTQALTVAISSGVTATLLFIAEFILMNVAVDLIFEYLVTQIGLDNSFYILLAIITATVISVGFPTQFPYATQLNAMATNLAKGLASASKAKIGDIQEELDELKSSYEARLKEIKEKQKELAIKNADMIKRIYTRVGMLPNESIDSYADRVTTVSNKIVDSVNYVWNYIDIMHETNFGLDLKQGIN